jgi:hypothetical protein
MAVFTVHSPPGDPPGAAERVVFVREGFSKAAFALPWAYLIAHRAWLPFAIYVAGAIGVALLAAALGARGGATLLAIVGYSLLFGLEAPALRQWSLRRKGYAQVASVVAASLEDAEMRFFSAAHAAPAAAPLLRRAPVAPPPQDGGPMFFAGPDPAR